MCAIEGITKFTIFSFILLLFLLACQQNYPLMNEYQIVGFIPYKDSDWGRLITWQDKLIFFCDSKNPWYHQVMRTYTLENPQSPEFIKETWLSEGIYDYYYFIQKDSRIFYTLDYDSVRIFDTENSSFSAFSLNCKIWSMALKDSLMFAQSDSGLVIFNISNLTNPVKIFCDSTSHYYQNYCQIAVEDTVCFEWFIDSIGTPIFKLWNIKNPYAPQIIGDSILYYYQIKNITINNNLVFFRDTYAVRRLCYDDSGHIYIKESYYSDDYIIDYKISDGKIYILTINKIIIGNANDFSQDWTEIPLERNYFLNYSFSIFKDLIYLFKRFAGVFIYERSE